MNRVTRLAALACVWLAIGCSELGAGPGLISKRIGEITGDPAAKEVDLPKLTSFGWDRFYFFKPGTSREAICKFIGANRNHCGRIIRYESVPADHMALLFGLNGSLTHVELHALAHGQFDVTLDERGLPKERCVFKVRRSTSGVGRDAVVLELR